MTSTRKTTRSRQLTTLTLGALFALSGCGGGSSDTPVAMRPAAGSNTLPAGVTQHSVTNYSATAVGTGTTAATQDLLTGGLGRSGLQAAAPAYADPLNPTALELRRNSLRANYQGLVDVSANGGYGTLYGPNVTAAGTVTTGDGLIPGREYFASLDDGTGNKRVVMAVLIPDSFDTANPCLVLGPSSGSRNVYGAIGSAGEWGLKRGCAVALTDAGKGTGYHDLMDDTVNTVDGTRATRTAAGALNHFAAVVTDAARTAYNALFPNRVAIKQAQSQKNPEKDWGTDTLVAAQYAFYALNDRYGSSTDPTPFNAANTLVIAGSVSNGGAAVVRAAEADTTGLIDGVVAGEPVLQMPRQTGYSVLFAGAAVPGQGRHLADYTTLGNIYQPCAARAVAAQMTETSTFNYMSLITATTATAAVPNNMNAKADNRCASLAAKGLVTGATLAEQAADALSRLRAYGWTDEHVQMHNAHWGLGNGPILSAMYPMAYGRFSALDNICNTSFAAANASGDVIAMPAATKAQTFAVGNGTANGTPATVIYNDSVGGAKQWLWARSPSAAGQVYEQDYGLDNALCQRALVTGVDPVTNTPLTALTTPTLAQSLAVQAGMAETTVTGNLRGKPTLIVHGRSDALVPVNMNSRAYAAFNRATEGAGSKLHYIEVTNAQHFDGFLGLSGFDNRYVPLHVYYIRAMDAMYAHLKNGTPLPPSQVVRTTARGGAPGSAPAIGASNVPVFSTAPGANEIAFGTTSVSVPN